MEIELGRGGIVQPVRLVLLLLDGPREGENDFLEFPSLDDAVAYGREMYGSSRFQLDGIEDERGRTLIGCDYLNDLCCSSQSMPMRRYG